MSAKDSSQPGLWRLWVALSFGAAFVAGMHLGSGRRGLCIAWLVIGLGWLGIAYYHERSRKPGA